MPDSLKNFDYKLPDLPHLELRATRNAFAMLIMVNGNLITNTSEATQGVFARQYERGVFGAAAQEGITDAAVRHVIEKAAQNAKLLARSSVQDMALPKVSAKQLSAHRKPEVISVSRCLELLRSIDEMVQGAIGQQEISRTIIMRQECFERKLITTDAGGGHSVLPRTTVYVKLSTKDKNGQPVDYSDCLFCLPTLEDGWAAKESFARKIESIIDILCQKSTAGYAQAGEHTVVLSPMLTGLLAHEAMGHTVESDLVRAGSVVHDMRGKQVASELVSMVDFAHHAFGQECVLPIYIDDEGTEAEDATIIENGILKGFLTNRRDAALLGIEPNGCARAYGYDDEPLVRMRNTCILPGQSSLDEMIASVDKGYYLLNWQNGQADLTSEFMFGVTMGYEIEDGKIKAPIRDTTLSGVAVDLLKTVSMVGHDLEWGAFGTCGKKQPCPNSFGAPSIKCKATLGGR